MIKTLKFEKFITTIFYFLKEAEIFRKQVINDELNSN